MGRIKRLSCFVFFHVLMFFIDAHQPVDVHIKVNHCALSKKGQKLSIDTCNELARNNFVMNLALASILSPHLLYVTRLRGGARSSDSTLLKHQFKKKSPTFVSGGFLNQRRKRKESKPSRRSKGILDESTRKRLRQASLLRRSVAAINRKPKGKSAPADTIYEEGGNMDEDAQEAQGGSSQDSWPEEMYASHPPLLAARRKREFRRLVARRFADVSRMLPILQSKLGHFQNLSASADLLLRPSPATQATPQLISAVRDAAREFLRCGPPAGCGPEWSALLDLEDDRLGEVVRTALSISTGAGAGGPGDVGGDAVTRVVDRFRRLCKGPPAAWQRQPCQRVARDEGGGGDARGDLSGRGQGEPPLTPPAPRPAPRPLTAAGP
jgi:hypothetical protein